MRGSRPKNRPTLAATAVRELNRMPYVPYFDEQGPKVWRCFFCDVVFPDPEAARGHFGNYIPQGGDVPACIDPLRTDESARLKELRDARDRAVVSAAESAQARAAAIYFESEAQMWKQKYEALIANRVSDEVLA